MKRRRFLKATTLSNLGLLAVPATFEGKMISDSRFEKIKIGQIGVCHEHASGYISTLKKLSDIFEIAGVVDDRKTKAAKFAGSNLKSFEGLKWMSEEELFNVPGLQAVLIETPNTDLVATALRCTKHNLAIHMDKPAGENLELFGKLLDRCKERNLPFQMGYMFRNNLAMQFCMKAVERGWLGDIFAIQADMSHNYGGELYQKYLSNFKGGIMFNLGCHLIDLVVSMLGQPVRITPFLQSTNGAANGAKNNCLTIMEYPNALASIHACDLETNGIMNRRFKISGSKGTIELSPLEIFGKSLQLNLRLVEGNVEYSAGNHLVDFGIKLDRYEDQLIEFAKMIRGEMGNNYTYDYEYRLHKVIMAASGYIKWNLS